VKEVVTAGKLPEADPGAWPEKFRQPKGCFVTLTKGGKLRGCIGHIVPVEPLYKAVMQNAESAARRDYRFNPVQPNELDQLSIEVSVLTEPQPLAFSSPEDLLARLQPHQDGVVLQVGGHQATFLPQVWEQIPDKVGFLNALAQKAGAPPSAWREPGATVSIYHVEAFKESE
jgi:AmmeMemoRadiSam system protein A